MDQGFLGIPPAFLWPVQSPQHPDQGLVPDKGTSRIQKAYGITSCSTGEIMGPGSSKVSPCLHFMLHM